MEEDRSGRGPDERDRLRGRSVQAQGGRGLDPNAQGGAQGGPRDAQFGGPFGGPTWGTYGNRPLTPEEIRSYRQEFQQRLGDAEELRRSLENAGADTEELEEVMAAFRELTDPRPYGNLPELEQLSNQLREGLQRLEFRLRREVEGDVAERGVLQGSDEVPDGFRGLVEEYFRALSRAGGN